MSILIVVPHAACDATHPDPNMRICDKRAWIAAEWLFGDLVEIDVSVEIFVNACVKRRVMDMNRKASRHSLFRRALTEKMRTADVLVAMHSHQGKKCCDGTKSISLLDSRKPNQAPSPFVRRLFVALNRLFPNRIEMIPSPPYADIDAQAYRMKLPHVIIEVNENDTILTPGELVKAMRVVARAVALELE